MASMSRRVFLKCAGAAALAVTASGIFAGCSEEGGGSKDTVYGVNETVQINGVNVKLLGLSTGSDFGHGRELCRKNVHHRVHRAG